MDHVVKYGGAVASVSMTKAPTSTKDEEEDNTYFPPNDALDLYDSQNPCVDLEWYSASIFEESLNLSSADTTIHVVRIYLKVFALFLARNGMKMFTRSVAYPMDNRVDIFKKLDEMGFVLIGEHLDDHVFAKNDILVSVFDNGYINAYSSSPMKNENVFESLNTLLKISEEIKNRAYVLEQTSGGFNFRPYPINMRELIEENYMPSVSEQLPQLYAVVNSEDPFGRLAILEGAPGGGKTSLIRGMMNEFGKPKFVVVPPYLVSHLNSPSMISSLVAEQAHDPRPLVLVLEDADSCLVKRGGDNMSNISAVLNLADGILSDTLDIRMVATTNADRVDLDPALERNGRIGAYIQVPPLSMERAVSILGRLTNEEVPPEELEEIIIRHATSERGFELTNMVLADVYAVAAKENGTYNHVNIPSKKKGKVGF